MEIALDKVLPNPMRELDVSGSGVWKVENLHIPSGQFGEVLAPSGKGKSTLLSILYGLRKDYAGTVQLAGEDIRHWSPGRWVSERRNHLSMVFQGLELFPTLTGFENIQLKNKLTNCFSEKEIREMADHLEVEPFLSKKVGHLSFGQQQRVALIRALAMPFKWLMLDEPFSHLDEALKQKSWELIVDKARSQQAGVLLATLDPSYLPGIQTSIKI